MNSGPSNKIVASILYLGPNTGTSRHRAAALQRLGYRVTIVDPHAFVPRLPYMLSWTHHTGGLLLGSYIQHRILESLGNERYDLTWVDAGVLVGPGLVRELRRRFGPVVNYNVDDPYGSRDGRKWRLYLKSVPHYDLVAVVRSPNVEEARRFGARDVMLVNRSADEVAHAPRSLSSEDRKRWASDVVFVGTWMPERGPFMAKLVNAGVPLTLYGDRWQRAVEWPTLQPHWRGSGLYNQDDYSRACQCAKVCLGLLSSENRDTVTQRSFEIPYLGGVFCAQRTEEHLSLYEENKEAVFWSSPEECAAQCKRLLADDAWREQLRIAGQARCIRNGTVNEAVLRSILDRVAQNEAASDGSAGRALPQNASR